MHRPARRRPETDRQLAPKAHRAIVARGVGPPPRRPLSAAARSGLRIRAAVTRTARDRTTVEHGAIDLTRLGARGAAAAVARCDAIRDGAGAADPAAQRSGVLAAPASRGEISERGVRAEHAASGKLFVATTNGSASKRPGLYRCNLDGTACSYVDISAGRGADSGYGRSLVIDGAKKVRRGEARALRFLRKDQAVANARIGRV
jgi:hypothetical protein